MPYTSSIRAEWRHIASPISINIGSGRARYILSPNQCLQSKKLQDVVSVHRQIKCISEVSVTHNICFILSEAAQHAHEQIFCFEKQISVALTLSVGWFRYCLYKSIYHGICFLRFTPSYYTYIYILLSIVAFVYLHVYFVLLIFIFNHRYLQNYLYDYSF